MRSSQGQPVVNPFRHVGIRARAPWVNPADIEEAKRRNPLSRFLRLWKCVWTSDVGDCAINDDDLQAALTIPNGPMHHLDVFNGRYSFLGGLDLAYRRDHAGYVVWASDHEMQRVRLAEAHEWSPVAGRDIDLRDVRRAIIESRNRFGVNAVFADEAQAVLLGQLLAEDGIYLIPSPQAGKLAAGRAMALVDAFKSQIVDLYEHPAMIRDLKKLRVVERNNSVRLEADADENGHADVAFAGSFALEQAVLNCRMQLAGVDFSVEFIST